MMPHLAQESQGGPPREIKVGDHEAWEAVATQVSHSPKVSECGVGPRLSAKAWADPLRRGRGIE